MTRRPLLVILLACALPRFLALAVWPVDPDTLYYALSTGLVRDHLLAINGGVTARIEPFYPMALAAGRLFTGDHPDALVVLQILAASAGGMLLFLFTRDQAGDARAAWIAALLYAVSPYLIRQSVAFMEVTAATVLLIAAALVLQRVFFCLKAEADHEAGSHTTCDLVASAFSRKSPRRLAPLRNRAHAFLVGADCDRCGDADRVARRRQAGSSRHRRRGRVPASLPALQSRHHRHAAAAARRREPVRVHERYTRPIVPTLNVDLLLPLVDELVRDEMVRRGNANYDLADQDRLLWDWAIAFARSHPADTLAMKAKNVACIFQPRLLPFYEMSGRATLVDGRLEIPEQESRPLIFEVAAAGFQALLLAGAVTGLVMRRDQWRDDAFLLVVAITIIGVQTVFFPTSRLLAPMTFVLIFYTAVAMTRLVNRVAGRLVQPEV